VLERLKRSLGLEDSDVLLGRWLIENHTMLGTLVQGERSAYEVYHWLCNNIRPPLSHKVYLAYLLLLNGMDVAGYRQTPIIMTPYWLNRYIELSSVSQIKEYVEDAQRFAERRLCELARAEITDVGDEPQKSAFHRQVRQELQGLTLDEKTVLGTMWIRDALYFLLRVHERGIAKARWNQTGGWSTDYARCYVRLFQALARIALDANAQAIAFRQGCNSNPKEEMPSGVDELLESLAAGRSVVSGAFRQKKPAHTAEFIISVNGLLCPLE